MSGSEFAQQLINALALGSIYAMLALGLAMVYSTLGILNFAYGELVTITGYTMYFTALAGLPFLLCAVLGVLAALASSMLMELFAFRPLRRSSFVTILFASFAVSQILQGFFRQAISPRYKGVPVPDLLGETVSLGELRVSVLSLVTMAVGIASMLLILAFMRYARAGVQMRAAAEDFTTARLMGVRANRVILVAFALSGALAGVAGVLWIARTSAVNPSSGFVPILAAFIAIVIGGLGSIPGAVIGGFVLGAIEIFLHVLLPGSLVPFEQAAALIVVVLLLAVRPQGLAGRLIEAKV
jgi:branched-chain amino acid transport system permease protein